MVTKIVQKGQRKKREIGVSHTSSIGLSHTLAIGVSHTDFEATKRHKKKGNHNQSRCGSPSSRDDVTRTRDPYVPNVVRYQLRYIPNQPEHKALSESAAKVRKNYG